MLAADEALPRAWSLHRVGIVRMLVCRHSDKDVDDDDDDVRAAAKTAHDQGFLGAG